MAKRSKSSQRWLDRQRKDPFRRRAVREGEVSRAVYKLEALDRRFGLLRKGRRVLELGAAPGGWTGYVARRVAPAEVVACDLLPMNPPGGVVFIQGDVETDVTRQALASAVGAAGVELVLSDMAPNMSGNKVRDQAAAMELVAVTLGFAVQDDAKILNPGGNLVVKMFQGDGFEAALEALRRHFERVAMVKPPASRKTSREFYAVAQGARERGSATDAEVDGRPRFAADSDVE